MTDVQLAFSLHNEGKFEEAEKLYKEFLNENPEQPDVSNLLGLIYLQTKQLDKAEKYFEIAIKGFPCAEFYQNLGLVFFNQKLYEKAMDCFSKAIEFEPNNVDFIRNFAKMAKKTGQTKKAIEFYEKSLKVEPHDEIGLNNLGLLYEKLHDYKTAKSCYQKSLKVTKNFEALHNLGILYRTERNFDESIKCLTEALKLKPHNQETMISLGISHLAKKEIKKGYEILSKCPNSMFSRKTKDKYKNYWIDGEKHKESTILVYYNGGYGDIIMFSRYLPFLTEYFKTVKFYLPSSLRDLFTQNFPQIEIVSFNDEKQDYCANVMELIHLLNMNFDNIPFPSGYLKANEELVKSFKEKYFLTNKKKIGIFWQGNQAVLPNRSIKLEEMKKLFELENCQFYSIEKEDNNQLQDFKNIIDLQNELSTFSQTAAIIENLNILITIDSAVAHLAGAMGKKTYLMLPYASEWRWFKDEKNTPWYDSVEIFKQKEHWNWATVVNEIYNILKISD